MKIVMGGGCPKYRKIPRLVRWGDNLSIFWLGYELVFMKKAPLTSRKYKEKQNNG